MTRRLQWRIADRDDRLLLSGFRSTEPSAGRLYGRSLHPREWERYVDKLIHEYRPSSTVPEDLLLGFLDDELAAVALVGPVKEEPDAFHIGIIAVRRDVRGTRLGDEVLEHAVRHIAQAAASAGSDTVTVTANIDLRNDASIRCFERAEFSRTGSDGEYGQWSLEVEVR